MESRIEKIIEAEGAVVVTRGWGVGEIRCWPRALSFIYARWVSPGGLLPSRATVSNRLVLQLEIRYEGRP